MNSSLSHRGQLASNSVLRVDFELYFEAVKNHYHKNENPEGAFPLNVAENKLSWPLLKAKIEQLSKEHSVPNWVANYTNSTGAPPFREIVAKFMARFIADCEIDPEHLGLSAGATSVIDLTSWILGEPGDVAVFPAPCYPVYKQDIGNKSGMERYNLITHHDVEELANGPLLSIAHLESTLKNIEGEGKRFRLLVITNPDNPTGGMFTSTQLTEIADWCIAHEIHLIVNEIYCLSLINTHHPELESDYSKHIPFYPFAQVMRDKQSDYLHTWYALSKDFGASGFRVGLVYSLNETFMAAYNNLNAPSMVSNYTQWMLGLALDDHKFIERYIASNQQQLTESYLIVVKALRALSIPYAPSYGSLFVWLDMSQFLNENSQTAESEFWLALYKETGILLTPGDGFGHTKRGQFRLVYSCVSKTELAVAMNRLSTYMGSIR